MTHKKHALRQAFITTVATAGTLFALGATGCSEVQVDQNICQHGDEGCDEPCPSGKPANGSFCQQDGQECWFSSGECSDTIASCDGGVWSVSEQQSSCNPPPPDPTCPQALPEQGTPCDSWAGPYQCDGYVDPFCGVPVTAYCDGSWSVDLVTCNPPPVDLCWSMEDEGSCAAQGFCAWLEPSCDATTSVPQAGCYPTDDCSINGCFGAGECQAVSFHPCPDGSCNSCSVDQAVCVPPSG